MGAGWAFEAQNFFATDFTAASKSWLAGLIEPLRLRVMPTCLTHGLPVACSALSWPARASQ